MATHSLMPRHRLALLLVVLLATGVILYFSHERDLGTRTVMLAAMALNVAALIVLLVGAIRR